MLSLYLLLQLLGLFSVLGFGEIVCTPKPGTPTNSPMGTAIGIRPGRVAWSFNPRSTSWPGPNNTIKGWWKFVDASIVDEMVSDVIRSVAGDAETLKDAWDAIFRFRNAEKQRLRSGQKLLSRGFVSGEKIGIKINLNGDYIDYHTNRGNQVSPQFLMSLVRSLVEDASVPEEDITIFDSSRLLFHYYVDDPSTGIWSEFPKVQFGDNLGRIPGTFADSPAPLLDDSSHIYFSNTSVVGWNECLVPNTAYESDYLIVVDDLRGHKAAGVTASAKNFFGSVYFYNTWCKWPVNYTVIHTHFCPQPLHPFIQAASVPMGSYSPLVDLLGHPLLGANTLLYMVGGLYGGPANIGSTDDDGQLFPVLPEPFVSSPFNGHWTSSVMASLDPVALDSVLFDILQNEPVVPLARIGCVDNYLHEASNAESPPSGTLYRPDGEHQLQSLGVHEHWNGPDKKEYTRNLGTGDGIELVRIGF